MGDEKGCRLIRRQLDVLDKEEDSKMIEREVNAMMSVADVLEARSERRGEQRGRVEVLLQFGKTDAEIIQYLTANLNDPLTKEESIEILESCRKENH